MVRRRARGFTLIELMVATFILGVGLVSVAGLFMGGFLSSRKAERISAAVNAAQKQIERIRSAGFSGCVVDPEIFTTDDGYTILHQHSDLTGRIGFAVPELQNGQGVIEIAFYTSPSGYYPNLKVVTLTITWTGGKPTGGRAVLKTFIANRP